MGFGDLLRRKREGAKKTMGQLARHLGVSVAYLSDVEHGRRAPLTRDKLEKTAAFLETDLTELLRIASEQRGAFELDAAVRPRAQELGAALMRSWSNLDDEKLDQLLRILEEGEK